MANERYVLSKYFIRYKLGYRSNTKTKTRRLQLTPY